MLSSPVNAHKNKFNFFQFRVFKKNLLNKIKFKKEHRLIGNWCKNHNFLDQKSLDFATFNFKNWKNRKGQLEDIKK